MGGCSTLSLDTVKVREIERDNRSTFPFLYYLLIITTGVSSRQSDNATEGTRDCELLKIRPDLTFSPWVAVRSVRNQSRLSILSTIVIHAPFPLPHPRIQGFPPG